MNKRLSLVLHTRFCSYRFQLPVIFSTLACCFIFSEVVNIYQPIYAAADFNFAAVGDFGCNANTDATVTNIRNKNPELVLALGDYSYQSTATCWLFKILPIDNITRVNIGDHEDEDTEGFNQYMNHFGITVPYYSFNYHNVHVLTMTTQSDLTLGSTQYNFIVNDLQSASQNPNIDWIIVSFHYWMYRSSDTNPVSDENVNIYHPIFDKYQVDLVLSGDVHNYQRTYPIKYNPSNASSPVIESTHPNDYADPEGPIFAIVGTGGINRSPIVGKSQFVVEQQDDYYGQLDIKFTNNGDKLEGRFYKNYDNGIFDRFSITKNVGGGSGNYTHQALP